MYNYRKNNPRPRRHSGGSDEAPLKVGDIAPDGQKIIGISEEGRYITGITDGNIHDPQAEIIDEQGETSYHDLSKQRAIRMCAPDDHDLQPEGEVGEEIPGTQSMKCRKCAYGVLQPIK
ncbi:hypothetical protein HZA56_14000 [Candidatus Poribacteria bacterium]|nr:hypothetical protein [Candidatus Poribacteria bacterium]